MKKLLIGEVNKVEGFSASTLLECTYQALQKIQLFTHCSNGLFYYTAFALAKTMYKCMVKDYSYRPRFWGRRDQQTVKQKGCYFQSCLKSIHCGYENVVANHSPESTIHFIDI